jgi:EAL domain-containing protein (putative c-di-GMP-specific phosphodiesterase class I)
MLSRSSLVPLVESVAEQAGIAPSLLRLEITETTLMEGVDQVVQVLADLRQLGVEISIDDFGTGYSSLVHFTRHPIGELKIDKDFVKGLGVEPRAEGVVAAVIAMGRALELRVVAEGVENALQFHTLQRLGCNRVQGMLFAPPLDAKAFSEFHAQMEALPEAPWCAG